MPELRIETFQAPVMIAGSFGVYVAVVHLVVVSVLGA
jgi:hypothetical protein